MRNFQALNYWGKDSDAMDAYVADPTTGAIYIDPNTTPLWSPSIPVNFLFVGCGPGQVALRSLSMLPSLQDRFPTLNWAEDAAKVATPTTPAVSGLGSAAAAEGEAAEAPSRTRGDDGPHCSHVPAQHLQRRGCSP